MNHVVVRRTGIVYLLVELWSDGFRVATRTSVSWKEVMKISERWVDQGSF